VKSTLTSFSLHRYLRCMLLSSDVLFSYFFPFAKLWRCYTAKDKIEHPGFDGAARVVTAQKDQIEIIRGMWFRSNT
jgi:hypothetical protein